jgi:serine/threonine protein kinase
LERCAASLDQIFLKTYHPRKYDGPELPNYSTVFLQLAEGLEYIHSKNLIHRDIKPGNVLIYVDSTDGKITMKWADFGLSKLVNEKGSYTMSGVKGTYTHLAPELLLKLMENEKKPGRGTVKSDVFALGLVFAYLLLNGKHLYGSNEIEISPNIIAHKQVNINSKFRIGYSKL